MFEGLGFNIVEQVSRVWEFTVGIGDISFDEFLELLVAIGEPHRTVVELGDELMGSIGVEGHVVEAHHAEFLVLVEDMDIGEYWLVGIVIGECAAFGFEVFVCF